MSDEEDKRSYSGIKANQVGHNVVLRKGNYVVWAAYMQELLAEKGVWGIVDCTAVAPTVPPPTSTNGAIVAAAEESVQVFTSKIAAHLFVRERRRYCGDSNDDSACDVGPAAE